MANKVHVKMNDKVLVLNGKDAGKEGKVIGVNPTDMTVLVNGVNIVSKHQKTKGKQQGGIIKQEAYISSSKVMLVCPYCQKPTKIAKDFLPNGEKVRKCKKCKEQIDVIKKAKA